MASRGVTTVPVFYVTEDGVVYSIQESDYAADKSHDNVEESRIRLANVLRQRKQKENANEGSSRVEPTNTASATVSVESPPCEDSNPVNHMGDWYSSEDDDDDESDSSSDDFEPDETEVSSPYHRPVADPPLPGTLEVDTERTRRLVRHGASQQQRLATSLLQRDEQLRRNQMLARSAARTMRGQQASKALPSQFVYQPSPADNAAARAIVHHTGSHYHMAGGVQFQRGVRVKGVVSRHSKQGAKMQAARMAQRNMYEAREDARGERTEGAGRSKMKQKKKKKEAGASKDA